MTRICVYCGSSPGARPEYAAAARRLGELLAERKLALVYGGSDLGVMGQVAGAALDAGGEVIGVIPRAMHEKVNHPALTRLHVVESMHDRKALMFELADGFIALPGGVGTVEEFMEVLTWAQLGTHGKPCGLLNVCDYFGSLLAFLDHAVSQRFVKPAHREMILVDSRPEGLLDRFARYVPPTVDKWLR